MDYLLKYPTTNCYEPKSSLALKQEIKDNVLSENSNERTSKLAPSEHFLTPNNTVKSEENFQKKLYNQKALRAIPKELLNENQRTTIVELDNKENDSLPKNTKVEHAIMARLLKDLDLTQKKIARDLFGDCGDDEGNRILQPERDCQNNVKVVQKTPGVFTENRLQINKPSSASAFRDNSKLLEKIGRKMYSASGLRRTNQEKSCQDKYNSKSSFKFNGIDSTRSVNVRDSIIASIKEKIVYVPEKSKSGGDSSTNWNDSEHENQKATNFKFPRETKTAMMIMMNKSNLKNHREIEKQSKLVRQVETQTSPISSDTTITRKVSQLPCSKNLLCDKGLHNGKCGRKSVLVKKNLSQGNANKGPQPAFHSESTDHFFDLKSSPKTLCIFQKENLGPVSEEQGEMFHQDLKELEDRYQERWNFTMMVDYCWLLKYDNPNRKFQRKSHNRSFGKKRTRFHKN